MSYKASRVPVLALAAVLLLGLSACEAKYRHEVEGGLLEETNYQTGMGGFIRYDGYSQGRTAIIGDMEISCVDYKHPKENVNVTLVGVVHLADEGYYRELQERELNGADLVLYEGVGAADRPGHVEPMNSQLWATVAQCLGLAAQTATIDYERPNFKQVDLVAANEIPDQAASREILGKLQAAQAAIQELQRELGRSLDLTRFQDALKHTQAAGLAQSNEAMNLEPIIEFVHELRHGLEDLEGIVPPESLKRIDEALNNAEAALTNFQELIIGGRNAHVVGVLEEEIGKTLDDTDEGKALHIAIFYGAGHNADLQDRLLEQGYARGGERWYKAWAMNGRGQPRMVVNDLQASHHGHHGHAEQPGLTAEEVSAWTADELIRSLYTRRQEDLFYESEKLPANVKELAGRPRTVKLIVAAYEEQFAPNIGLEDDPVFRFNLVAIANQKLKNGTFSGPKERNVALKFLASTLEDEFQWVRAEAVWGLGLYGNKRQLKAVEGLFDDPDELVATEAHKAADLIKARAEADEAKKSAEDAAKEAEGAKPQAK